MKFRISDEATSETYNGRTMGAVLSKHYGPRSNYDTGDMLKGESSKLKIFRVTDADPRGELIAIATQVADGKGGVSAIMING